ncbi:MAG: 50S ribosomal protein L10 [Nanoarchaeota archaeon]|nr:50S ribosomal protein L10 [Nanoarchaeota archaeon]
MLTRKQKEILAKEESKKIGETKTLIFTDFTGLSASAGDALRKSLRELGAKYRVMKKRILGIVLKDHGIPITAKDLKGQVGVVLSPEGMPETAGKVFTFFKENKERFKILGGVEMEGKRVFAKAEVEMIGNLPSREVLLGQLVYMIGSPIRSLAFVLQERAKVK